MNLALTKQEKRTLLRKFRSEGMDEHRAIKRIKDLNNQQKDLGKKLRKKKMKVKDINKQFQEEFERVLLE
jgi:predicted transcriptional regulator